MRVTYGGRTAAFDPESLSFSNDPDSGPRLGREPLAPQEPSSRDDAVELARSRRVLERLVLNVSNACNLNCGYCYAQGGSYGGNREFMTLENGRSAIARFLEAYDEVASVQFFGGEPLLNWHVIRDLCQYGWDLADTLGKPRPVWMLSTNGTVLNDGILQMLRDYDLKVTVSIDGPPEINDRLRPSEHGGPSTADVVNHVLAMKDQTGQPAQVEGTFTSLHVREGCTVRDVLEFVHTALDVVAVHMPVNVLTAGGPHDRTEPFGIGPADVESVIDMYADASADAVDTLARHPTGSKAILSGALELIEELVLPRANEHPVICPAGTGTIAVDVEGSVYPCFMFYNRHAFRLGHIRADDLIAAPKQTAFVADLHRGHSSPLATSFARRFITGCAGSNFFKGSDHGAMAAPEVRLVEAMLQAAVVQLAWLEPDGGDLAYVPVALQLHKLYLDSPLVA